MGPLKSSRPPAQEGVLQMSGPGRAMSSNGSACGFSGRGGWLGTPENKVNFILA